MLGFFTFYLDVFFLLSLPRLLLDLIVLIRSRNCLLFVSTRVHPRCFGGVLVAHIFSFCVVLLCVFTFWVPCCDVRYDFRIKIMFGSSLPAVVCRKARVLFTLFAFASYNGIQHIWGCAFALFVFVLLSVSMDCPFWLPLRYSLTFICSDI
jgi:hypothetical protein